MKALSLLQPWASLVAIGAKQIETRSWSTPYRGPLLIHASKGFTPQCRQMAYHDEPFRSVLARAHLIPTQAHGMTVENLPLGVIVAKCDLIECVPIHFIVEQAQTPYPYRVTWRGQSIDYILNEQEQAFGDYTFGRFAWLLANVTPTNSPIAARGSLGLWNYLGPLPEAIA
jgi:activating signal cointegrator 1